MYIFLSHCRKIEELASKTYQQFARNMTYSKKVRKVFQKLSDDERSHARNIDLVLQASKQEADALPRVAWEKLKDSENLAEELFRVACRGDLSEEKALQIAIQIEQEFIKIHIQNVLQFHNPKLVELFDTLNAEDRKHIDTLSECLRWWRSKFENDKPHQIQ